MTVYRITSDNNIIRVSSRNQTIKIINNGRGPQGPTGPQGIPGDPATNLVTSVNGKQGAVVLNATDVGADPTGSAAQALQDAKDYTDTEVSTLDASLATVAKTGSYNDLTGTDNVVENVGTSADNALARFDGTTGKLVQNSGVTLTDQDTLDGVSAVNFDTAGGVTPTAGSLSYNATERVLEMGTGFTGTTIQVGMENVVRVRNSTGATIANGAVVYVNGAQGNRPTVALADADIQAQAMAVIGVATHDIANNSDGLITTEGIVRDLNTNAYNEGDVLYLSGTPGQFTTTPPVSPQTRVDVAVVTRAHNTQGEILVRPQVIVQKSDIGLEEVNNTSDMDKPVSTATQTALDLKANSNAVVDLTTDQTVGGRKTFILLPILGSDPISSVHAARKAYVDTADALKLNISDSRVMRQGTGFPNGVVTAPVGSIYIDTAVTNGASSWIKKSGTGNTGWQVLEGDTGWRTITKDPSVLNGVISMKRTASAVYMKVALSNGWYGSTPPNGTTICVPPSGFATDMYLEAYHINGTFKLMSVESSQVKLWGSPSNSVVSSYVAYSTSQAWPTTLP